MEASGGMSLCKKLMGDYESTPEGWMWHAVLVTYYYDAWARSMTEREWNSLLYTANSEWTKWICASIQLKHEFFIENLKKVRSRRKEIKYMNCGAYDFYEGVPEK